MIHELCSCLLNTIQKPFKCSSDIFGTSCVNKKYTQWPFKTVQVELRKNVIHEVGLFKALSIFRLPVVIVETQKLQNQTNGISKYAQCVNLKGRKLPKVEFDLIWFYWELRQKHQIHISMVSFQQRGQHQETHQSCRWGPQYRQKF